MYIPGDAVQPVSPVSSIRSRPGQPSCREGEDRRER